jgi:hypothetical protein
MAHRKTISKYEQMSGSLSAPADTEKSTDNFVRKEQQGDGKISTTRKMCKRISPVSKAGKKIDLRVQATASAKSVERLGAIL